MINNKERIALVPGSFDPFTVGHRDVVIKAAAVFDRVVVAVMINDSKKYMFSSEERVVIAKKSLSDVANVEVIYDGGMLVDLFDKVGASAIVKGIRNAEDLAYENKMAKYNSEQNPRAVTVYVPAEDGHAEVSSTAVRAREGDDEAFFEYLCDGARDYVRDVLRRR